VLGGLLRQLVRPSPAAQALPDCAFRGEDERWHALGKADVAAIDDPWDDNYVVLRRDRGKFLGFLARGLRCAWRLLFAHGRTVRKWRAEASQLTGPRFWYEYLGVTAAEAPGGDPLQAP
jgi:hypothetical protein